MIDIKLIRETPEIVKANIKKKFQNDKLKVVDKIKKKDEEWRELKKKVDDLRHRRNVISEEINKLKKAGKDAKKQILEAKKIPPEIEKTEGKSNKLEEEIKSLLIQIPNIIHPSVPLGKDASQNVEVKKIGKPAKFTFPIRIHQDIGDKLGVLDFDKSAKISGTGFYILESELALLNQALIRFVIDKMVSKNFRYVELPLMLRKEVIGKVADLNDMNNQIYKIEGEDLYLIGTSEHSLIGRFIDNALREKDLPIKHTSYSMCFRKEIGSHGINEKGLYRTHQFNKVEMIVICKPEESMKFFEELKNITIETFKELEIPVRVLEICSGDLGDLKHKQVDIEAWSPKLKDYYEIGSCSNLTDAQARRLGIRAISSQGERYFPHTLNNTAIATSRALVAILENFQQKDGSVAIPKVLHKYMNGKKKIEAKSDNGKREKNKK